MRETTVTNISQAYLDVHNACAFVSLSRRTLDRAKDEGNLPFYKVGKKVLFRVDDLSAWMERKRVDVLADAAAIEGRG